MWELLHGPPLIDRRLIDTSPRVTIDLTDDQPLPPPPRRIIHSRITETDPIFNMSASDLVSQLPRVSGDPKPFHKSDDIEIVSVQTSNRDPISLKQISIPVRGRNCLHTACYDLEMFLKFVREQQKTWKCPLCQEDATPPSKLVFVEYNFVDSMLT